MLLKKFTILLVVFCVGAQALALDVEETPSYKKHRKQRPLISSYWERFKRSKRASNDSGAYIAAQVVLQDAEDELLMAGFSNEDLDQLRAEATASFEEDKKDVVAAVTRDTVFDIYDKMSDLPTPEIDNRIKAFLSDNTEYQKTFHELGLKVDDAIVYRMVARFFLLSIIQNTGYNFATDQGKKMLTKIAADLDFFGSFILDQPFSEAAIQKIRRIKFKDKWALMNPILKAWSDAHPIVKQFEFWGAAWFTLKDWSTTFFTGKRGHHLIWISLFPLVIFGAIYGQDHFASWQLHPGHQYQAWEVWADTTFFPWMKTYGLPLYVMGWGGYYLRLYRYHLFNNFRNKDSNKKRTEGLQFLNQCRRAMGRVR